ncbi:MAG: hypothetical protein AB7P07_11575 [Hyphomonadaceae bacterium]
MGTGRRIRGAELGRLVRHAVRTRTAIDFSGDVLDRPAKDVVGPTVVKAYAEEIPKDTESTPHLTLREFEDLSLAARGRLFGLPPSTDPAAPAWARRFQRMPMLKAEALKRAILEIADSKPAKSHRRPSLHLIGAYIDGELDLTNVSAQISVRLLGCAINGAVRVGRANLVTLDLSGSAVKGVFASFLRASGSVRLRRLMSSSVVDFGGAKIADVLDASDAVVFPLHDPAPQEALVGDRGIFNLSLAELQNEARFLRARIYGGLTLKGCTVARSFFMDDAIVRAPIAFLERLGADVLREAAPELEDNLPLAIRTSWRAEEKLARELHGDPEDDEKTAVERRLRIEFETLRSFNMAAAMGKRIARGGKLFKRLLEESSRARSSCVRADGIDIKGSLFARSLRAGGRFRCNYGHIGGSLHLNGARMRSSEDIGDGIERILELLSGRTIAIGWRGFKGFAEEQLGLIQADKLGATLSDDAAAPHTRLKREKAENENYAIEARDARIDGSVQLGMDSRRGKIHHYDEKLCAVVTERLNEHCGCVNPCECRRINSAWEKSVADHGAHHHSPYINGQVVFDGATIDGDLNLKGMLANLHTVLPVQPCKTDVCAFLRIKQARIEGSVFLDSSINVSGVDAQQVFVGAHVRCSDHSVRNKTITARALMLSGRMQFSDAEIGGDATLLFDRQAGPALLLARAKISGRLHILPARLLEADSRARTMRRRNLAKDAPHSGELAPDIDLRAAKAAEFGHSEGAWPEQDCLLVEGFTYEQSVAYGPLQPRPRRDLASVHAGMADYRESHREPVFWAMLAFATVAALFLMVIAGHSGLLADANVMFGYQNIGLFLLCVVGGLVQFAVGVLSMPNRKSGSPRAIYWLGLQRAAPSVYRKKGVTIPLQPYVQAGKVLRSAGLILSANLLEVDRLRRRHEQLSWRNNWPVRSLLTAAEATTKYGFDPLRTILIALTVAAIGGAIFHMADRRGHIRPVDGDLLQVIVAEAKTGSSPPQVVETSLFGVQPCAERAEGCAARVASRYPAFSSLLYAIDVMAPGLDLGQEHYWRASTTRFPDEAPHPVFGRVAPILKIIGWLLATAIAVSIVTRIEAMISRHEE